MTITGGLKSGGTSVIGGGSFVDFTIEEPIVAGLITYVLTVEIALSPPAGTIAIRKLKMLQIAKSK
jgi:hypothetical protein